MEPVHPGHAPILAVEATPGKCVPMRTRHGKEDLGSLKSKDKLTPNVYALTINFSAQFIPFRLNSAQYRDGCVGGRGHYGLRNGNYSDRPIAMRPKNALGYRRHPFRQHGDVDHARRAHFPTLPQQLSAGLASGSGATDAQRNRGGPSRQEAGNR